MVTTAVRTSKKAGLSLKLDSASVRTKLAPSAPPSASPAGAFPALERALLLPALPAPIIFEPPLPPPPPLAPVVAAELPLELSFLSPGTAPPVVEPFPHVAEGWLGCITARRSLEKVYLRLVSRQGYGKGGREYATARRWDCGVDMLAT